MLAYNSFLHLNSFDNRHLRTYTESLIMITATTTAFNRQLQQDGKNTIEEFCRRVEEVVRRHDPDSGVPHLLERWQNGDYNAAFLRTDIQPELLHLRHTLMQKQYRADGNIEQLEETRRVIQSGAAEQHLLDTIYAHVFVEWSRHFLKLSEEATAVA